MLFYTVETAIPLLTALLIWAWMMARRHDFARHKKIAMSHAAATWASYVVVIVMVELGYTMGGKAPEWIMNLHLVIIYIIAPLIAVMMFTGFSGKRVAHRALAFSYLTLWTAALITGGMIFMMDKGYL